MKGSAKVGAGPGQPGAAWLGNGPVIQATAPAPQPHQGLYHLPPWAVPSVGKWLRNSQGSSGGLSHQEWSQKDLWPGCLALARAVAEGLRYMLYSSHQCARPGDRERGHRQSPKAQPPGGGGQLSSAPGENEPNTPELFWGIQLNLTVGKQSPEENGVS